MNEKVRVLHVIDSFDLGGAQTALLNLVRFADRERFEPEVACMHGRGVFWESFAALRVPLHSLSPAKWLPVYIWRLALLLISRRYAIVHCHLFGSNWIAKPIAALLDVRVLINHDQCNDGLRYNSRPALWLDTITNRLSSHICAVSQSTRDFLIAREGVSANRVSLVYNGVDVERFAPAKPDEQRAAGELLIAGVGRLHPQKDFGLFLEVAAELTRRGNDARFLIAGTGPEETALRAQAVALEIADRVQFAGHVADMREVYERADVLLLTSRYEGTPLTILEAMAAGVPIVASRLDGIAEVLVDGTDGFLAAPGARKEFVSKLAMLLADRELRRRFAKAAREKVVASFSAKAMTAQVESIYEQCLSNA